MKKISLILFLAGLIWTVQTAQAQTQDTTKNTIEIKKKVRKGAHGRTITKIKMTGTGTPGAINDAAESAVTGHSKPQPTPAPIVVTPPPPAPEPTVVVVHDTVRTPAPAPVPVVVPAPAPTTTQVTTTTETKPAVAANVSTHHATRTSTTYHRPAHTYHKTYKKTTATPATKTTTTTTVKKTE
ncbi:MAG: hypothetical protein ABIN13_16600 [Mucilaginibacter sp.]